MANELAHWGIKGMRWGVRRYQNRDGSLTKAGRKRYKDSVPAKNEGPAETLDQKKQRILSTHSAKTIYENKDIFSDKEIQDAFLRLNNEKNIRQLIPEEVSRGKQAIAKYADISKNIKTVVDSTSTLYESYKKGRKLMNAIFGD